MKKFKPYTRADKLARIRKRGFAISYQIDADNKFRGRLRVTKNGLVVIGSVNQIYGYLFSGM